MGLTRDLPIISRHDVTPVLGWHISGIRLRGKSEFMDFYSLTMGFGLKLMTRYQGSWNYINCAFLSFSYDYIDLLYKNNKLKRGHTISLGFGRSF